MAGFDETALQRLNELQSKAKGGTKLPPAEALELKELKLLKSAAEIAKGRAEIAVAKRKIEDREKYRVGGLAVAAGLHLWSDADLKAAFAKLAAGGKEPPAQHGGGQLGETSPQSEGGGYSETHATQEYAGNDERRF